MYSDPQDEIPRTNGQGSPSRSRSRRAIAIAVGVAVALILGLVIGHLTAPTKTVPVAVATSSSPADPASSPVDTATSPTDTSSPSDSISDTSTDTATADTSASASDPSGANATGPVYLSQINAIDQGDALNSPEDKTISGVDYPNSIQQESRGNSGSTTVWDVEHYKTFTAEVGVDDSTAADGETIRIVFLNQASVQLGTTQVAVGSPKRVNIPLNGAVHFEIECITPDNSQDIPVTFGNAQFVP